MSLVQWRVREWSAITITLKLKGRSRKMANNRKIQLKSGLKTAHYNAEVKRKTINHNFVLNKL